MLSDAEEKQEVNYEEIISCSSLNVTGFRNALYDCLR